MEKDLSKPVYQTCPACGAEEQPKFCNVCYHLDMTEEEATELYNDLLRAFLGREPEP